MPNSWITSIKQYNQDKKISISKKGTVEYDAIKEIQRKNKEMVSSVPIPVIKETVKRVKVIKGVKGEGIKEVI